MEGVYTLHGTLRRLRRYYYPNAYVEDAHLEYCVADLLSAGGDPRARDCKGNTPLHYLADSGLPEVWHQVIPRERYFTPCSMTNNADRLSVLIRCWAVGHPDAFRWR